MTCDFNTLGYAYLKSDDLSGSDNIQEAGSLLAYFFTQKALLIVFETGLDAEFVNESEPYDSPTDMINDIRDNNHMAIADTVEGTTPLWSPTANNCMRLWHDYTHHYLLEVGFDMEGEFEAYRRAVDEFTNWSKDVPGVDDGIRRAAITILFSEMVLQPAAATWLGGYDATRQGLSFSQKIVDLGYYGI